MSVPSSLLELLFFAALVVPGITYAWAKRRFVGWQAPNQDVGSRVLEALFVSAAFLIVYGAVFFFISGATGEGAAIQLDIATRQWPGAWVWILGAGLLVGLPILAAHFLNARWVRVPMSDGTTKRKQVNRAKDTPRGWDKGAFTAYTRDLSASKRPICADRIPQIANSRSVSKRIERVWAGHRHPRTRAVGADALYRKFEMNPETSGN